MAPNRRQRQSNGGYVVAAKIQEGESTTTFYSWRGGAPAPSRDRLDTNYRQVSYKISGLNLEFIKDEMRVLQDNNSLPERWEEFPFAKVAFIDEESHEQKWVKELWFTPDYYSAGSWLEIVWEHEWEEFRKKIAAAKFINKSLATFHHKPWVVYDCERMIRVVLRPMSTLQKFNNYTPIAFNARADAWALNLTK